MRKPTEHLKILNIDFYIKENRDNDYDKKSKDKNNHRMFILCVYVSIVGKIIKVEYDVERRRASLMGWAVQSFLNY